MLSPALIDNRGRKVKEWLPHMQSGDFLRQMISAGIRTEECWAELKSRNSRVQAARQVLSKLNDCNGHERIYEDGSGYICRHCGIDMDDED